MGKDFGGGKVFQVLMICDHIDRSTGTFEEVSPDTESLKDCEQFFVMGVIIEFRGTEGAGISDVQAQAQSPEKPKPSLGP